MRDEDRQYKCPWKASKEKMLKVFPYKARLMHKQFGDERIVSVCFYDEFMVLIGEAEPDDNTNTIYRKLPRK